MKAVLLLCDKVVGRFPVPEPIVRSRCGYLARPSRLLGDPKTERRRTRRVTVYEQSEGCYWEIHFAMVGRARSREGEPYPRGCENAGDLQANGMEELSTGFY